MKTKSMVRKLKEEAVKGQHFERAKMLRKWEKELDYEEQMFQKLSRGEVEKDMIYYWASKKGTSERDMYMFIDGWERLCNLEDANLVTIEYMRFVNKSINVYYHWNYKGQERRYDTLVCGNYTFHKAGQKLIGNCEYHPNKVPGSMRLGKNKK